MQLIMPKTDAVRAPRTEGGAPAIVSVLSGKGGVGKTILSANLAVAMAAECGKVLLVDCDLSAGQSHLVLGISPVNGLAQVLRGEKKLHQILVKGFKNLHLAPGGPCGGSAVELQGAEVRRLAAEARHAVPSLKAVVLDAGPGRPSAASEFAGVADIPLVLTTPEPTAMRATLALLESILSERPEATLYVVVNMASCEREARETFDRIAAALLPVFSGDLKYLGWVAFDLEVTRSLWRYRPVVAGVPHGRAARGFLALRDALVPVMEGNGGIAIEGDAPGRATGEGAGHGRDSRTSFGGELPSDSRESSEPGDAPTEDAGETGDGDARAA